MPPWRNATVGGGGTVAVTIVALVAGSNGNPDSGTPLTLRHRDRGHQPGRRRDRPDYRRRRPGTRRPDADPDVAELRRTAARRQPGRLCDLGHAGARRHPRLVQSERIGCRHGRGVLHDGHGARPCHGGFPQGTNGVAALETRDTAATGDQLAVANYLYPLRPVTPIVYARRAAGRGAGVHARRSVRHLDGATGAGLGRADRPCSCKRTRRSRRRRSSKATAPRRSAPLADCHLSRSPRRRRGRSRRRPVIFSPSERSPIPDGDPSGFQRRRHPAGDDAAAAARPCLAPRSRLDAVGVVPGAGANLRSQHGVGGTGSGRRQSGDDRQSVGRVGKVARLARRLHGERTPRSSSGRRRCGRSGPREVR